MSQRSIMSEPMCVTGRYTTIPHNICIKQSCISVSGLFYKYCVIKTSTQKNMGKICTCSYS